MAKRRLRRCQKGPPRNTGTAATARPLPLTTPQCSTHWTVLKCVQANACPCRAANRPCTGVFPSDNCRNHGLTRGPTAPRLTNNASETIAEAQEATPTLCQAIDPFVFYPDAPAFLPSVLLRGDDWLALPARVNTTHATPALTDTAATTLLHQRPSGEAK